jgi:hypothetical protein
MDQIFNEDVELSIIVAIIAGGDGPTTSCLTALASQINEHIECLVPYDSRLPGARELARKFPWADFIDARSAVDSEEFGSSSREHHDILRAIGLNQARGRIVALLEDHGTPSPEWISATVQAHGDDCTAVGGAVENGVDRLLNWAVYFCDFGRYQNPVPEGPAEFLSDSNVTYKKDVLQSVKHLWVNAFHETSVNWELQRRGHVLRLNPRMVVYQTRQTLRLLPALHERYVWGRSFAGTRATEVSTTRRLTLAALSFLLPVVLTSRIVLFGLRKRTHLAKLFLALPLIFLLETIWSTGEFIGYLTRRTGSSQRATYAQTDSVS